MRDEELDPDGSLEADGNIEIGWVLVQGRTKSEREETPLRPGGKVEAAENTLVTC